MHDGVPTITVILDGGWSKGTHKHSCNAKSGVAVVIWQATGKLYVQHLGVLKKYCSVCTVVENQKVPPPYQDFLRDWDGPFSSVETDILVNAYQEAEKN